MSLNEKDFKKITDKLIPCLSNINYKNPQLIITFVGIPSSGKTEISKKLERKYKAIRINGDLIYDIAEELGLASNYWALERVKKEYILKFLPKNPFRNKLLILDKGLDRMYKEFFLACRKNNLRYFIIQLDLSKKEAIKRIKKRNPERWKSWLLKLDRWIKENNDFKNNAEANLVFDANKINFRKICLEVEKIFKNESKTRA